MIQYLASYISNSCLHSRADFSFPTNYGTCVISNKRQHTYNMLFKETNTEESGPSQDDVSSLDNGFSVLQFDSSSSEELVTDDGDDDVLERNRIRIR